jgi:hypothetical protein
MMIALLQIMSNEFAADALITAQVANRCSFALDPQNATSLPLITYNAVELERSSKDDLIDYELTITFLATDVEQLLTIYDAARVVMDNNVQGFTSYFQGSSAVDAWDEKDDIFIIDQNYKIEYKP